VSITVRPYDRPQDYDRIGQFLLDIYQPGDKPGNWQQARWEYMHYHPYMDQSAHDRIGVWEEDGDIVGVANYEEQLGEAFFQIRPGYAHLKSEMLAYAEDYLFARLNDGRAHLRAYINDFDAEFESIAEQQGYLKRDDASQPTSRYVITSPFPEIVVRDGFRLKSLEEDNDLYKSDRALWRGFNHPGEPPADGVDGRKLMQSAPNFRKDLNIVVEAPDGSFVAYSGMWYLPANRIAYVEPVATDPDYRRLGLGTAAVLEGIRRCGELGATVAFVGSGQEFYKGMGFKELCVQYAWTKSFDPTAPAPRPHIRAGQSSG
jgi:GNAT superfamily N-acetyltransferase